MSSLLMKDSEGLQVAQYTQEDQQGGKRSRGCAANLLSHSFQSFSSFMIIGSSVFLLGQLKSFRLGCLLWVRRS